MKKQKLTRCVQGIFFMTLAVYLVGRGGSLHWFADLFSHWQWQYAGISLICFLCFLLLGRWLWSVGVLIFCCLLVLPLFAHQTERAREADIYFLNALYTNDNISPYQDDIRTLNPRIVAIVEIPAALRQAILDIGYREIVSLQSKYDSQAFFAREDVATQISDARIDDKFPYPIGHISYLGRHILLIHPYPGILGGLGENQHISFAQTRELLDSYAQKGEDFVVLGDFNSSVFSPLFQQYFGSYFSNNHFTWQRGTPFALPIDHAVSNTPVRISPEPRRTSDHSALVVDI